MNTVKKLFLKHKLRTTLTYINNNKKFKKINKKQSKFE